MQVTFTPSICTDADAKYEGKVTIRMPTYMERLDFIEASPSGDDEGATEHEILRRRMKAMAAMARMVQERGHVVSVDLKRLADGYKIDATEFWFDSDMSAVINEVVAKIVGKYSVGAGPQ